MGMSWKPYIAVVGAADATAEELRLASDVGRMLAEAGAVMVCGGLGGVMDEAARGGARITRPAGETFWGGYAGLFVDPDGHPWEVAHNPHWTLDEDGSVRLA